MLKEMYHRLPDESNYQEGILEHSNALETYVEKIKMILNTTKGEVLGFPNFGTNLENLIFETDVDENALRNEIFYQINEHCAEADFFETDVKVSFLRGTVRDIAVIDIIIENEKLITALIK